MRRLLRHKAAHGTGKVCFLRMRKASGRRRFVSGVYPQSMCGVQQFGLSPTAVRTLRRQAARAWSTLGQGRCLTSVLALELGDQDPAKCIVGCHFGAGSTFGFTSLHRVKGTLSATIATLCELRWDPPGPVHWNTLDGAQFSLVTEGAAADPRYLRREFSAAIDQQLWAQAAQHEQGQGLQHGVDWQATRLHLSPLKKRGQHKEANFLVACHTGALWPLQRQHDCPRR